MKIKKSLIKVILVGGIFFISSLSFLAVVSFENMELNSFWIVKKLDISFLNSSYAESGNAESGKYSRKSKESGGYNSKTFSNSTSISGNSSSSGSNNCKTVYDTVTTASGYTTKDYRQECDTPIVPTPVKTSINNIDTSNYIEPIKTIDVKKNELTLIEKNELKTRFESVNEIILKKYSTNSKKLEIYKKLNKLLDEKISTLELIKTNISNDLVLEKYEKKILLFKELSLFIQSEILFYIDSIDLEQIQLLKDEETARIAAQQAAAAKAAEAARIAAQQAAAAKAAEAARIAAQQAAAAKAAEAVRIAAQQAAAAKVNTKTKAS